jgi:arsenite methyltransferase
MRLDGNRWEQWILDERSGGDAGVAEAITRDIREMAEGMLQLGNLFEGGVLLDVGTGDGVIAFTALPHLGKSGRAILCDSSLGLLEHARKFAETSGVIDRCSFVVASADDLSPIANDCVDFVTTRAVLVYVANRGKALKEFFRVLKPGGRIILSEPIVGELSQHYPRFTSWELPQIKELIVRLRAFYDGIQPASNVMINFNEWNMVRYCEEAGFADLYLNKTIKFTSGYLKDWQALLRSSPNPFVPPLAEALDSIFSPTERARIEQHLRPFIEQGSDDRIDSAVYVWAVKRA